MYNTYYSMMFVKEKYVSTYCEGVTLRNGRIVVWMLWTCLPCTLDSVLKNLLRIVWMFVTMKGRAGHARHNKKWDNLHIRASLTWKKRGILSDNATSSVCLKTHNLELYWVIKCFTKFFYQRKICHSGVKLIDLNASSETK